MSRHNVKWLELRKSLAEKISYLRATTDEGDYHNFDFLNTHVQRYLFYGCAQRIP
jgi:hypothetical protein